MSKTTRKKESAAPITREAMEAALIEYRAARADERAAYDAHDAAITAADNALGVAVPPIELRIKNAFATLKAWAASNPAEFEKVRSIAKPAGTIGYRLGNWTVKAVTGKTLESALEFILTRKRLRLKYARFVPQLNKEALLVNRLALTRRPRLLEKIGIRFHQDNSFFADANLSTVETVKKEVA